MFLKGDLVVVTALEDDTLYSVVDIEGDEVVLRDLRMENPQLVVSTSSVSRFVGEGLDLLVFILHRVQALQIAISDTETVAVLGNFLAADVVVREQGE